MSLQVRNKPNKFRLKLFNTHMNFFGGASNPLFSKEASDLLNIDFQKHNIVEIIQDISEKTSQLAKEPQQSEYAARMQEKEAESWNLL